jgi:ketosteroid isomerase-like protein
MSQENVEIVRHGFVGWDRGDLVPEECWADDLEWHASPDDPDSAVFRGRASVDAVLHEWLSHLGRYRAEFEFIDAENEVFVCMRAFLERATAPLVAHFACRVADGKINRVRAYSQRDEALKAVGLAE